VVDQRLKDFGAAGARDRTEVAITAYAESEVHMSFRWRSKARGDFGAKVAILLLLSLGLGTATLLYTALNRLVVNPLGVVHPESLVRAAFRQPPLMNWKWFHYSTFEAMRPMHSFEDIAVEGLIDTTAVAGGTTQPVTAEMVSGSYFSLLGAKAELGRALNHADDVGNSGAVPVVISHRFWMSNFGGSKSAIGATVSVQGIPFTVCGVMPGWFIGTQLDLAIPDLWLPLSAEPLLSPIPLTSPDSGRNFTFSIIARLRSGVTIAQAQSEFSGVYRAVEEREGEMHPDSQGLIQPAEEGAFPLHSQFDHAIVLLLWCLATLLLMMSANVAGLLLVKAARNQRESAIRMALGSGRRRLICTALIEALWLGLAGAGGGVLVGRVCAPLLKSLLPLGITELPISLVPDLKTDARAVLLALGISLAFGVIPAWIASRVAPQQVLRNGTATRRTGPLVRWLLILQTGVCFVLLVGTGLLVHTFYVLAHTNPGFDVDHLITFTVDSRLYGGSKDLGLSLPWELQRRIQALPGVRNASLASVALMRRIGLKVSVGLPSQKIRQQDFLNTSEDSVSSTFFDTLGLPILSGRSFSEAESAHSLDATQDLSEREATNLPLLPVVINEAFAHMMFPQENPLGKTFGSAPPGQIAKRTFVVIGIAGDSKYRSLREALLPIFYRLYSPKTGQPQFYLYVRTQGPPEAIIHSARQVLATLAPGLPFSRVETMHEQISDSLWQERLLAVLAGVFSVFSLLMAAMGLYALLAYDATQRTPEFGIRTAVGAQRRDLVILLYKELVQIVVPGLVIGLVACLFLARLIASELYGIKPLDPSSLAGALLIVAVIGFISVWQPIRYATKVDPATVLREQ